MAYYNGTVANMDGLLTAITNACVADGWTYSGGELVKHGCYFPISVDTYVTGYKRLKVQIKNPTTTNVSPISCFREMSNAVISYPAEYHIFSFNYEVYCVLNIQPGTYAWIAFGKCSVSLPGTGAYLSASCGPSVSTTAEPTRPGFFAANSATSGAHSHHVHTGLSYPSEFYAGISGTVLPLPASTWYQSNYCVGKTQPNAFSGESILTPMLIYSAYAVSSYCLVHASRDARFLRIDNYEDEQLITYGSDQWMIFPWCKRNSSSRDSVDQYYQLNSGTLGMAIRYEGP